MNGGMYSMETSDAQKAAFHEVWPLLWKVPFYERKLRDAGLVPTPSLLLSELVRVPFTHKAEIRLADVLTRSPYALRDIRYLLSSSGTTGQATVYAWVDEDDRVLYAASRRALNRISCSDDDLALILAPFGLPVIGHCLMSQYAAVGAAIAPLGVRPPDEVWQTLLTLPVTIIATLPIIATRLLEFAAARALPLPPSLRHLHLGGGYLSAARRRRLQEMSNATVFNLFGMSEIFGPFGGECHEQQGFHYIDDYLLIEVIDPETKRPVPPGKPGVAVYTTLWAKGAPLLRYWSDDLIVELPDRCNCGDPAPRFCYVGRPHERIVVDGKPIYAHQVEEMLFSFPVGSEFTVRVQTIGSQEIFDVAVEELPGSDVDLAALNACLEEVLRRPTTARVVALGTFPRDNPKPKVMIDER